MALAVLLALPGCRRGPAARVKSPRERPLDIRQVVLITQHAPDDQSLTQQAKEALDKLASPTVKVRCLQVPPELARDAVRKAAAEGAGLVILLGEEYLNPAEEAVKLLDTTRVACIGGEEVKTNVETVDIRLGEAAYLCGVLAGLTSQTRIGTALAEDRTGMQTDCVLAFTNGGVAANPAFRTLDAGYSHARTAEATAEAARLAVTGGADMLFQTTPVPQAVFAAAEARPNVFAFGSFGDQSGLAPKVVLASAVIDLDAVFAGILKRARADGTMRRVTHSLADSTVRFELNPVFRDRLAPQTLAQLRQTEADLRAGKINVRLFPESQPTTAP